MSWHLICFTDEQDLLVFSIKNFSKSCWYGCPSTTPARISLRKLVCFLSSTSSLWADNQDIANSNVRRPTTGWKWYSLQRPHFSSKWGAANLYKPLSAFAPVDSRDGVSDKEASFQMEHECSWSGSSETWVNRNTHQYITQTEKQRCCITPQILLAVMLIFSCSGISIGLSVLVWLMVCVFPGCEISSPRAQNSLHNSVWSLPPPWVVPLGPAANAAPAYFCLRLRAGALLYIQPCLALPPLH